MKRIKSFRRIKDRESKLYALTYSPGKYHICRWSYTDSSFYTISGGWEWEHGFIDIDTGDKLQIWEISPREEKQGRCVVWYELYELSNSREEVNKLLMMGSLMR